MNHQVAPWIQTFTGLKFCFDQKINQIDIVDIAHALSMQCRYAGHSKFFYSVAQHCYLSSYLVPDDLRLHALLHDAAEAYLGDITKPLKQFFGGKYIRLENDIQDLINANFGVVETPRSILDVKIADLQLLRLEAEKVLGNPPIDDWHIDLPEQDVFQHIIQMSPEKAKRKYLERFEWLYGKNH